MSQSRQLLPAFGIGRRKEVSDALYLGCCANSVRTHSHALSWRASGRLIWLYLAGLLIFGLLAGPRLLRQSPNEFVALAEALLAGRLDIAAELAPYLDVATFAGRHYVPYPPAPALLYAPAVATFGRGLYHGVLHVLLAAAVMPLFYLTLRRYTVDTGHSEAERLWLAVALALGTVVAPLAVDSKVYYAGQVVAVLFACLYLLAACKGRRPAWAGLALGLAFLARGALLLAAPLAIVEIWRANGRGAAAGHRRTAALARFAVALGLVLAAASAYNWARFGNPLEMGYRYLIWDDAATISRWGLFDYVYLERNLHAALLALPVLLPQFPYLAFHPEGMSLLITTPLLALLITLRQWTSRALAALMSAALVALPSLFYANTGFVQYGYRYAADFLPFLVLAMALAGLRVNTRRAKLLILTGVVVCLLGAFLAGRHPFSPAQARLIEANTLLRYR